MRKALGAFSKHGYPSHKDVRKSIFALAMSHVYISVIRLHPCVHNIEAYGSAICLQWGCVNTNLL